MIKAIYKIISGYYKSICNFPRRLCNTIYYTLSDKNGVIVVNAPFFQFLDKVRCYNIGDDLNYYLVRELSGKKVFAYWDFYHFNKPISNIMVIGSVIDWMGNAQTTVWGAGILSSPKYGQPSKKQHCLVNKALAVRGEKTRKCLLAAGIKCPEVYGDPALLMPYVYKPKVEKVKGRIGFIPHYVDMGNENIKRLMRECGDDALLIKVRNYKSWQDVIDQICSCEFVISSSLHGLILSDTYGVPNQWITLTKGILGGNFKFEDYYSSVGKTASAFEVTAKTSINELILLKDKYQKILFDPRPLLQACPFEINNASVVNMMGAN